MLFIITYHWLKYKAIGLGWGQLNVFALRARLEFTESGHAPVKIEGVVVGAMTSVLVEIDVVAVGKQLKLIIKGIIQAILFVIT